MVAVLLTLALEFPGQVFNGPELPFCPPPIIVVVPCPQPVVAEQRGPAAEQRGPAADPRFSYYPPQKQDVVLRWNEAALQAIKAERSPPPLAARNLAILHVAVYDAVNAVQRTHKPFQVEVNLPAGAADAETAAAVAGHRTLSALYPRQASRLDAVIAESLQAIPESTQKSEGLRLGRYAADRVLEWRARDGADRQVAHRPGFIVGQWQPTLPDYKEGLLPQWAALAPFAMKSGSQFRPQPPPAFDTPDFIASFKEVKTLGGAGSPMRNKDQTEIAWFWADGEGTVTPPGHWNRIAQGLARERALALADNARLFAMLNVTLADSGISCWDAKYHYNYWRPISAVRHAHLLNNAELGGDRSWVPLLPTPPFPSYSSGHSTFSAAGATILAGFFGTDEVRFTDRSESLPGMSRTYASFSSAAAEAGRSRIFGGIHYEFDNVAGLASGKQLGEYVLKNHFQPIAR